MPRWWTEEECEFLQEMWGTYSVGWIADKLNRPATGVLSKARKLGCGRFLDSTDGISVYLLVQVLYKYENRNACGCKVYQWLREGLPARHMLVNKNRFYIVNLDAFWAWAEQHKGIVDFSRMEEGELGAEPAWVKEKRRIDKTKRAKWRRPWSAYEDALLRNLSVRGEPYRAYVEQLPERSESSIRKHVYELGLKQPPREQCRNWTQEEADTLQGMRKQGYSMDVIADKLGRSAKACYGKVRMMKEKAQWK